MQNENYPVEILVNGNKVKQYSYEGKLFIEAKEGSEFEIDIHNNTYNRILSIISVDGINALDGNPADIDGNGYVIDNNRNARIKGWRINDNEVSAFQFTKKESSYAAEKGSAINCGVVSVLLWSEKIQYLGANYIPNTIIIKENPYFYSPWWWGQTWCGTSNPPAASPSATWGSTAGSTLNNTIFTSSLSNCSNSSSNSSLSKTVDNFPLGVGWSDIKQSTVTSTSFQRDTIIHKVEIFYATRESLINMGVPLKNELKVSFPKSFPKKYCSIPTNYKL